MKHLLFIPLIFLFINAAITQNCLPEGITFSSQQQVDNFQNDYPGCTEIEGYVIILGDDITNLNGLSVVTTIGGNFSIGYQNAGNPKLKDITGLQNLTTIGGGLLITSNDSLTSFSGLQNLNSIGGDLSIAFNNGLTGLQELSGLSNIPLGFYYFGNPLVDDLNGLHNITAVGDDFYLQHTKLKNLTGLESLISVNGNLNISYNDSLINMMGLNNLETVNGMFWFEFNKSLLNLEGLESLTEAEFFRINSNESLLSLIGIENINADSLNGFKIRNNDMLSYCEVQSVCYHLLNPGENTEIRLNTNGCNSIDEVKEKCITSVVENTFFHNAICKPNPLTNSTSIEYSISYPSQVTFSIFSSFGELVHYVREQQQKGTQQIRWNADQLPAGIYFYSLEAGAQSATGKLILMK